MTRRELCAVALGFFAGAVCFSAALVAVDHHPEPAFTCRAERSATREGVEIVAYPHDAVFSRPGVSVRCPK